MYQTQQLKRQKGVCASDAVVRGSLVLGLFILFFLIVRQ
jgi:hypothetical protein